MADQPTRRESRQFATVVADPNAPSGALQSTAVEELLYEFQKATTAVILERLRSLPPEVAQVVRDVLMEHLRDVTEDRVLLIVGDVEARVKGALENSDRADLGGRTMKLRMHRSALWFAERYRQGGLNANVAPGEDRPTVRVTPARGTVETKK